MEKVNNQLFMIMLMDLVEENLLSPAEAEVAKEYYLKNEKKETGKRGSGRVA